MDINDYRDQFHSLCSSFIGVDWRADKNRKWIFEYCFCWRRWKEGCGGWTTYRFAIIWRFSVRFLSRPDEFLIGNESIGAITYTRIRGERFILERPSIAWIEARVHFRPGRINRFLNPFFFRPLSIILPIFSQFTFIEDRYEMILFFALLCSIKIERWSFFFFFFN